MKITCGAFSNTSNDKTDCYQTKRFQARPNGSASHSCLVLKSSVPQTLPK